MFKAIEETQKDLTFQIDPKFMVILGLITDLIKTTSIHLWTCLGHLAERLRHVPQDFSSSCHSPCIQGKVTLFWYLIKNLKRIYLLYLFWNGKSLNCTYYNVLNSLNSLNLSGLLIDVLVYCLIVIAKILWLWDIPPRINFACVAWHIWREVSTN